MLITCNIRHSCKLLLLFWTFFYGFDRSNLILLKGASMPFSYIHTYNIAWSLKISIQQQKVSDSSFWTYCFHFTNTITGDKMVKKSGNNSVFTNHYQCFILNRQMSEKKNSHESCCFPGAFVSSTQFSLCVCVCVCVCVCLCTLMCVMLSCLADCSQRSGTLQAP